MDRVGRDNSDRSSSGMAALYSHDSRSKFDDAPVRSPFFCSDFLHHFNLRAGSATNFLRRTSWHASGNYLTMSSTSSSALRKLHEIERRPGELYADELIATAQRREPKHEEQPSRAGRQWVLIDAYMARVPRAAMHLRCIDNDEFRP